MAVHTNGPGPYGPPAAVLSVIDRYRNRGLQVPIDGDVLMRAGVSDSLVNRTFNSLRMLDLVDEQGNPTEHLEALRLARTDEYQERFAEYLRGVYPDVFAYVDPAEDSEDAIRDAFRGYEPRGQQGRMVTLFLGLAEHAGMRKPATNGNGGDGTAPPAARSRPRSPAPVSRPRQTERRTDPPKGAPPPPREDVGALPPAIMGLLSSLPSEGDAWTQARRDRFLKTFEAVLDFCYPIREEQERLPLEV
ncbi:MAG TPA: DUF5343 domain-containing protein [Longimicrobiaceae bacterium]|nr:DUF5343 domain-containing protein [Longimicrobiaceae bacterium]